MKEFCKACDQALPKSGFMDRISGEEKYMEFGDGKYCINCGRAKIDAARKK